MTDKERNERFYKALRITYIMEEIFERYPLKSTIPKFRKKLRKMGFSVFKHIHMDDFCNHYYNETQDLVLEYYKKSTWCYDKSYYICCLFSNKKSEVYNFVLKEMEKYNQEQLEILYLIELIKNCIFITRDIKHEKKYIKYLQYNDYKLCPEKEIFFDICCDLNIEGTYKYIKKELKHGLKDEEIINAINKYKKDDPKFTKLIKNKKIDYNNIRFKKAIKWIEEQDNKTITPSKDGNINQFISQLNNLFNTKYQSLNEIINLCKDNPHETQQLIIQYYNKTKLLSDKRFYIKCLTNKENIDIFDFLIKELIKCRNLRTEEEKITTAIDGYFDYCYNKDYKQEIIEILKNDKYSLRHWAFMETCGKNNIREAIPYIINTLKLEPTYPIALNALAKYKDKQELKEIFEYYSTYYDTDCRNIAKKALKKINS